MNPQAILKTRKLLKTEYTKMLNDTAMVHGWYTARRSYNPCAMLTQQKPRA